MSLRLLNKIPRFVCHGDCASVLCHRAANPGMLCLLELLWVRLALLGNSLPQSGRRLVEFRADEDVLPQWPCFFCSTLRFNDLFQIKEDPGEVVIDFKDCRIVDHSGLEAIQALAEKYQSAGKSLALVKLSDKCQSMLSGVAPTAEVGCRTEDASLDEASEGVKMIKILADADVTVVVW